ncbi:MAG TPA: carboxymuconolactone decarboxylase family protein [Micromonosporaceae bacterium]|jgi:Uncharacterized conserved protein
MPHIPVSDDLPGIRGLLAFKPASGIKVAQLIEQLLRGDSPLSPADRERIAAHVSLLNECEFCARSHAAAIGHLDVQAPATRPTTPDHGATPRLRALLDLAGEVTRGGRDVTPETVKNARAAGASDEDIHDTVLIAAAFCMLNRYVDGLGAITPSDDAAYDAMGIQMAAHGYLGAAPPMG